MFFLDATAAGAASGSIFSTLIFMVPLILVMYFFMIRPQKKAEKKATAMRNSLEIGDTVTTIGGIMGIVSSIKEDSIVIETGGERNKIRFKRSAVAEVQKLVIDQPTEK